MILSGEGGLAFCAGGDIVSMYKAKIANVDRKMLWSILGKQYLLHYSLYLL